jgi:hypothetical protein
MSYKISKLGNIIKIENGIINLLILNDNNEEYKKYLQFLKKEGTVEYSDYLAEEELSQIKEQKIQELKQQQYKELQETDWYYIKNIETGVEIPIDILQERTLIRQKYDNLKLNITYE